MGADAARRLAREGFKVAILSSSGKGEALASELGGVGVTGSNQSTADMQRLVGLAMECGFGHGTLGPGGCAGQLGEAMAVE